MRATRDDDGLVAVPESVWSAMVRVYDTGQRLVLDRIELAKVELIGFARGELVVVARQMARSFVLALAGGILLVAGWFVLSWGLVNVVAGALPSSWRLIIEAALNLAVGGVLIRLAARSREAQTEKIDP